MYSIRKVTNRKYQILDPNGKPLKVSDMSTINKAFTSAPDFIFELPRKFALRQALRLNVAKGFINDVIFPQGEDDTYEPNKYPYNPCVHWSIAQSGLIDYLATDRPVYNDELFKHLNRRFECIYRSFDIAHSGMTLLQMKKSKEYATGRYFILVGSHMMHLNNGVLYDSAERGWDTRRVSHIYKINFYTN